MRTHNVCPTAIARIQGTEKYSKLWGETRFYQQKQSVLVEVIVWGLPDNNPSGFFGMHIHEGEKCAGEGLSETKGHYNPAAVSHPNHAGDLPPLIRCCGGAYLSFRTDRFCVRDIVGRTIVIHGKRDDFLSQPAGDAGEKIACGVICRGK